MIIVEPRIDNYRFSQTRLIFLIYDNSINRGYLLFSVKDRNLFHRVDTIGNIFSGGACLFHVFNPFWEKLYQNPAQFFSVIPRGAPLPHCNALQYYVKCEKCKVNDVTFGCEARAINLGNKNMKISIFTGGTGIRSKNIFEHWII